MSDEIAIRQDADRYTIVVAHEEYEDIRESVTETALSAVPAQWLPDDLRPVQGGVA